ncbi:14405_t:CDS:2, partial [Cetraspora pellucida]
DRLHHGHPNELEVHFAKECEDENLDDKIRSKYLEIVVQRQLSKEKTSLKNQSKKQKISINDYWENENQFLASSKKEAIDHTIIKAFAMCGLPFFIIKNPWFIDILKSLQSSYVSSTHKYLSNTLLNEEGASIYNFLIITPDHKEFLYALRDLSHVSHTMDLLFNEIEKILIKIGPEKFIGVISDNASAIAAAHRQINQKYPSIINLHCIVYFVNLISHDILKCKLSAYELNISRGGLKFFIEIRWTSAYKPVNSVFRLKLVLEMVIFNLLISIIDFMNVAKCFKRSFDAITNQDVRIILKSRGFSHDVEQISKIFAPIRATIL